MKIESADQDIHTMLSSAYYKIPRFQRPYSWDQENIQEFWDDIVRATHRTTSLVRWSFTKTVTNAMAACH